MIEFLKMGGYAAYVWPSFGLFCGYMVFASLASRARHRRALEQLERAASGGTQ